MRRSISSTLLLLLGLTLAVPEVSLGDSSLYWVDTNYGAPTLNRSDPDGLGVTTVNLAAGTLPQGLSVSSDGRVIWAEAAWSNARLMRAAYDLSNHTAEVTGQSAFRGVAVDDVNHAIYWTSSNLVTGAFIYRKTLNGPATQLIALPPGPTRAASPWTP